jgi:hypothetical protein
MTTRRCYLSLEATLPATIFLPEARSLAAGRT